MNTPSTKHIAIIGREKQTGNYQKALQLLSTHTLLSLTGKHFFSPPFAFDCEVTLSVGKLSHFDAIFLPGGGDIDPELLQEPDRGSRNIDKELDLIQFQALDLFVKNKKPVFGICKGFQLIQLYFGGKLMQDLPRPSIHPVTETGGDTYHRVHSLPLPQDRFPLSAFPATLTVNSAHHQGILKNGNSLFCFQTATDGISEGLIHETLPIAAFQWHPERMLLSENQTFQETGRLAFTLFFSLFDS